MKSSLGIRQLFGSKALDQSGAEARGHFLRTQTHLLVRQSRAGMFAAIVMAALLGVPMVPVTGAPIYAAWLIALCSGFALRQRLMERAQANGSAESVLRITVISAAALGLLLTLPAPLFFPHADASWRAFLTLVYAVWMTAAVAVLGVFPPSYKVFLTASMLNVILGWWLGAVPSDAMVVTAGLVLVWLVLTGFSGRVGRLVEDSVNIRHEREVLVQRLQQSLADTEAAQRARSRFLASASHDLLQPVHALLLLAGLSRDMPAGARRTDVLHQLHTTAESIDSMFRGLLDLARFDAGTLQPQLTSMPVTHVLRSIHDAYFARCIGKGVALTVESPQDVQVIADPSMFDRIVRNLVDNAVKFTPRGHIAVRCQADGDQVRIEVEDSGVGIAKDDLAHVQEAFYRGSSAREVEAEGVGLGLANSTQMARLLRGDIAILSIQGGGTTVRLTLPRGHGPQRSALRAGERKALRYLHIVLIEDDRTARQATELWLQAHGASVVATVDAGTAIEQCLARAFTPDFVLSDYHLGTAGTGLQAIDALRQRFGLLPAAIVSGEELAAVDLPPDIPLLAKPLRPERLQQLLG